MPDVLRIKKNFLYGLNALLFLPLPLYPVSAPELTADEPLEFDSATNSLVARGNAELSHENVLLEGQVLIFNQNTNTIQGRDQIRLTRDDTRLVTNHADYNHFERSFETRDFRFGRYPIYIEGKSASGTPQEIVVNKGNIYFNEPDPYGFSLRASKITLKDQENLILNDAVLLLGPVPVFYWPEYQQNINAEPPFSLKTDLGYQKSLGAFIQNRIIIKSPSFFRFGANLDGYTNRGFLGGPIFEYSKVFEKGNWIHGEINTGFIHDTGSTSELGVDILNRPINRSRNFIEWRHKQTLLERWDTTASVSWWSDSEVTRDFRPGLFIDNQRPDNFAESVYRGENWFLSAFLRFAPNDWEQVAQRMPEIRFDLVPTEIGETGIYHQLNASYSRLLEKDPLGILPELDSNRFNIYYGLQRPFKINSWLTATPVAGVMVTHYADTLGTSGNYTRILGEVGLDLSADIVGTWDYKNDLWEINGLRHLLRPVIQYRYIPSAQAGNTLIPPIDRRASFETYLEPIGLSDKRNIDDLWEENVIRLGLENLFQTRHREYGSRDLVNLNLYQDFRFTTRPAQVVPPGGPLYPSQNTFSSTYIELGVHPTYWLNNTILFRVDPSNLEIREVRTRTRILDGDRWSAYFGTNYVQDVPGGSINQFVVGADYRVNERNILRATWRVDARLHELTEQFYGWQTRLGNSWEVEFVVGYVQGSTREDNFQFRININLITF